MKASAKAFRRSVTFYARPPWKAGSFWIVLGSIVLVFIAQEVVGDLSKGHRTMIPLFVIVIAYAVPILYSALELGLLTTVITAALATIFVEFDAFRHLHQDHGVLSWADNVQIVILDVVAAIVGHFVEVAKHARNQASSFAARVIEGQEQERQSISQELHDEPLQLLMHLSRILDRVNSQVRDESEIRAELAEAHGLAVSIGASLRNIARGMRPPTLDDLGLAPAIERLVSDLARRSEIDATFESTAEGTGLEPDTELALYRIAQEALSNVEKHAKAHQVVVRLTTKSSEILLKVADDGIGQIPVVITDMRKMGIVGMRERARLLGGSLEITSGDGSGWTVTARLPLERSP